MTEEQLKLLDADYDPHKYRIYYAAFQHYYNNPKVKFCYCESEYKIWYKKARIRRIEEITLRQNQKENGKENSN